MVVALTACGGGSKSANTTSSTTSTTIAGPSAYIAYARSHPLGNKDLASATDDQLLGLGNSACGILSAGGTFGQVIQATIEAAKGSTSDEAQGFARAAVVNLCPEYSRSLP